jgi:hypothetical protein
MIDTTEQISTAETVTTPVEIVDINIPFGRAVIFLVKWSLAAIPALLILGCIGFALSVIFASMASVITTGH